MRKYFGQEVRPYEIPDPPDREADLMDEDPDELG
jgi:hypothetical protein